MLMLNVTRQKPARAGRTEAEYGESERSSISDETSNPRHETESTGSALLQAALTRENLQRAFKRVRANKGGAGVDGLDIDQTARQLVTSWPKLREQLLRGTYRPRPVRRVTIPKPEGGERELGIPTVTDRLIQQALLQVLQPILDSSFSEHSYGFRPGRRAQEAVLTAQAYVQSGRRIVVDVDLEKFFDRVSHDILIDRLQKRIPDKGVIRLIRAYLNSGIMKRMAWCKSGLKARRKAAHCHRYWRMFCSMKWIRNWSGAVIASYATPTTVMFTSAAKRWASG
jgi:retron-type reverse transcriptase